MIHRPLSILTAVWMGTLAVLLLTAEGMASEDTGREGLEKSDQKREADRGILLGVYGELLGIYDDILDQTSEGPRTLQRLLRAPEWLRFSVQHRTRYETLDHQWRFGQQGSDQQIAQRTRFMLSIREILDPFRGVLEFQDSRAFATDAGSFVNDSHVNKQDILQAHVDLAIKHFFGTEVPALFAVGRLSLDIGSGRWIARETFRNTTTSFDGGQWRLGDQDHDFTIRAFLVRPVRRLMETVDPLLPAQRHTLWGLYGESRHFDHINVSLYYFAHASEEAHRDFSMVGTRLWKNGEPGQFEYEIESAYQFGDIAQGHRFAHFQHAEIGYTFDLGWKPQILLRMDYAAPGFDDLYGRRSFELIPTGIFGPFQRTNLVSPGYRILVQPRKDLYVFVQHRGWWLADAMEPWARSELRDPSGFSGRYLGQTVELRARWAATDNVFLTAGYVHFSFGTFPDRVPGGPAAEQSNYSFVSAELIF
jgi:hypothetical protein